MANIIQLLPDSIANQIAAGEVVQRPSSVVKELLENSVDAGASHIKLIIKNAGKSLIQVIDNGKGMSERDIRLSIERHATSKIKESKDLFTIKSFGFRGEALASIGAISHMEIKSRQADDDIASLLKVEGTKVLDQSFCQAMPGTSIAVRNLFYNTPARRRFLKSDPVETRHIIDEFQRVAIPNVDVHFELIHNENQVFNLPTTHYKQRIIHLFGKKYNEKLVEVETKTNFVAVSGFLGVPDAAKKTRGEQFFFVNQRFIKNSYLNHSVQSAFEDLIAKNSYASYFLNLTVAPESIDVNIHPTKTEIKFEDERLIYAVIRAAVKEAIGRHNLSPSIDFEQEQLFPAPSSTSLPKSPDIMVNTDFNPFENVKNKASSGFNSGGNYHVRTKDITEGWEQFYAGAAKIETENKEEQQSSNQRIFSDEENSSSNESKSPFQLANSYIITSMKSGVLMVDQKRAHERILYEKFIRHLAQQKGLSQTELFPSEIELSAKDSVLLLEILPDITQLGISIKPVNETTFTVTGLPVDAQNISPRELIEGLLEKFKLNQTEVKLDRSRTIAFSLAQHSAVKRGTVMTTTEMQSLIDQLFACESPYLSPDGKSTLQIISVDEIAQKFN